MKPKLMYQEVGGWGTQWGGLDPAEGGGPTELPCHPPPTIIPVPQLKVPAEEPASELPMNEIEAWKAAEKVGAHRHPHSVSAMAWAALLGLTDCLLLPTESPLGPAGPHPGGCGLRCPDDSAVSMGIRRLASLWAQPAPSPLL